MINEFGQKLSFCIQASPTVTPKLPDEADAPEYLDISPSESGEHPEEMAASSFLNVDSSSKLCRFLEPG